MSTLLYEPGRLCQTLMNQPVLAPEGLRKPRQQDKSRGTPSRLRPQKQLPCSTSFPSPHHGDTWTTAWWEYVDSCVWLMSSLWNLSQWRGSQFRHCRQTAPTWGSVWRRRRGWAPSLWWWWVKTDRWHYLYMYRKGNIFSDPSCMTCSQFKVASS